MAEQEETRSFEHAQETKQSGTQPLPDDVLPTLFGGGQVAYKARPENFLASAITHIAGLVLLLWLLRVAAPAPKIMDAGNHESVPLIDPLLHLGGPSGGTGGNRNPAPPTKGTPPPSSLIQFVPPAAEPPEQAILQMRQTIVSLSRMPQSQIIGSPLFSLITHSAGPGSEGGIDDRKGHGVGTAPDGDGGGSEPVVNLNTGMIPPRGIYTPDPEFSDEARKTKHQGTVTLEVVIGTDGRVHNARVVRSLGAGLDENALEKVSIWKFDPARTRDGRRIAVRANIEVQFNLF